MKSKIFRTSFKAEIAQLPQVIEWLHKQLEAEQVERADIFCWELVLEEIVVNAIEHGFKGREGKIDLELNVVLGDHVGLTVIDHAPPFNPLKEAPRPDLDSPLEKRKVGGLGLYLVRKSVDEILYERREGKNVLYLTKRSSQTK